MQVPFVIWRIPARQAGTGQGQAGLLLFVTTHGGGSQVIPSALIAGRAEIDRGCHARGRAGDGGKKHENISMIPKDMFLLLNNFANGNTTESCSL